MCAQRTYRRAARGVRNAHVNAMLGSLQQLKHCLRKSSRKLPPELSKTQPGSTSNPLKSSPEAPMRAQMRARAPNMRGKGAQKTSKSAPKLPKRRPRAPQMAPRQAREAPKPLQNRARQAAASPKTRFGCDCPRQARSKGSRSDFLQFLALSAMLAKSVATQ